MALTFNLAQRTASIYPNTQILAKGMRAKEKWNYIFQQTMHPPPPECRTDTPEWLMEKVLMVYLCGSTVTPHSPRTTHHAWERETARSISFLLSVDRECGGGESHSIWPRRSRKISTLFHYTSGGRDWRCCWVPLPKDQIRCTSSHFSTHTCIPKTMLKRKEIACALLHR